MAGIAVYWNSCQSQLGVKGKHLSREKPSVAFKCDLFNVKMASISQKAVPVAVSVLVY